MSDYIHPNGNKATSSLETEDEVKSQTGEPLLTDINLSQERQYVRFMKPESRDARCTQHPWFPILSRMVLVGCAALTLPTLVITSIVCNTEMLSSQREVCIGDAGLNLTTPETDPPYKKLERRTVNGVSQICARTQDQLSVLMELIMGTKQDNTEFDMTQENSQTFTPVSAHKLLLAPVTENNIKEPTVIHKVNNALLKSATDNAPSEHAHGINVTNDSLLIRRQGLYYVYFGVHFQPVSDKPPREFEFQRSTAYVYRKSPNGQKQSNLLLQIAHTLCDNCTNNQETSFAGGSFYLEAGDHIQMSYSCLGIVKFNTEFTFLGLMMVDSEHRRNNWF
jgi:hypothetical protein